MLQTIDDEDVSILLAKLAKILPTEEVDEAKQIWLENPTKGVKTQLMETLRELESGYVKPRTVPIRLDGRMRRKGAVDHGRYAVHIRRGRGIWMWNENKVKLLPRGIAFSYLANSYSGYSANSYSLNDNVLDTLLQNAVIIPESWKDKRVFFLGTIYSRSGGYRSIYVRFLYWDGNEWSSAFESIGSHPGKNDYYVVFA